MGFRKNKHGFEEIGLKVSPLIINKLLSGYLLPMQ